MTWSQPGFEDIVRLLGARSGLAFPESRREGVEQGIRRAMERARVGDPARYVGLLETDARAFDDLLVELTVGETYFFREPEHFRFIRREVLAPARTRWAGSHLVRAWSAGCASGEEAYSLAIVLEEEGFGERSYVLATDVSRAALAKARRALYGAWSLRGEAAGAATRYLVRRGEHFAVPDRLRRRVHFDYLNLALDTYPSWATGTWGMDLILCRNVMLYFGRETVAAVARRLFAALAPGGWLITASSDPPVGGLAPFQTVTTGHGVFYQRPPVDGTRPVCASGETEEGTTQYPISNKEYPIPKLAGELRARDTEAGYGDEWSVAPVGKGPRAIPTFAETGAGENHAAAPAAADALTEARRAFDRGDYARAGELAAGCAEDPEAAAVHVRALANQDTARAERAGAEAATRHPLAAELHYLHAVLLLELGRHREAAAAARRALFLDRTLAAAHFTLGAVLRHAGDRRGARRAYRNARDLCRGRPADEAVPLAEGERAGRLAEAAEAQLALLGTAEEAP